MIIHSSQNTNLTKEMSKFQRGAVGKNLVMFYTQMGSHYNMFVEETYRLGKAKGMGKIPAWGRMGAFILTLFSVGTMANTFLKGRSPINDDKEPTLEDILKWAAKDTLIGAAKMYPIVGDMVASGLSSTGGYGYNPVSTLTVIAEGAFFIGTLAKMDGWKIAEDGAELVGYLTGVPTKQFMDWFYAFSRWLDDKPDFSLWEFIYGVPKKKRR